MKLHATLSALCLVAGACDDGAMTSGDAARTDARTDADAAADSSTSDSASLDGSPPGDAGAMVCTAFEDAVVLGNGESAALDEVSGMAASRTNADVLWVHNDSGDAARVFAVRTDGRHLGEFTLEGATNRDWEDMAIGPGPEAGRDYLYVGDVGDNAARDTGMGRAAAAIYRVAEPAVDADQAPVTVDLTDVDTFPLVYPAGPHDCEALMVDPSSGDVYLLTKENDGMSELYVARAPLVAEVTATLERVGELTFGAGAAPGGPFATGGDLSRDGGRLLIRTYSAVLLFERPADGAVPDALSTPPLSLPAAREMQGEAIAWAADGLGYYTMSEFADPPVHFYGAAAECAR